MKKAALIHRAAFLFVLRNCLKIERRFALGLFVLVAVTLMPLMAFLQAAVVMPFAGVPPSNGNYYHNACKYLKGLLCKTNYRQLLAAAS